MMKNQKERERRGWQETHTQQSILFEGICHVRDLPDREPENPIPWFKRHCLVCTGTEEQLLINYVKQ